tara:strand:- start:185 stop:373 length:189 start_codon:yes stop_codon:yes gene_type:complete
MSIPEMIDFQNKKWIVRAKLEEHKVDDYTKLKSSYDADLVLKNSQGWFFVLDEVVDAEFVDI